MCVMAENIILANSGDFSPQSFQIQTQPINILPTIPPSPHPSYDVYSWFWEINQVWNCRQFAATQWDSAHSSWHWVINLCAQKAKTQLSGGVIISALWFIFVLCILLVQTGSCSPLDPSQPLTISNSTYKVKIWIISDKRQINTLGPAKLLHVFQNKNLGWLLLCNEGRLE